MGNCKIGIIGCGNISGIYFKTLTQFQNTEVIACSDLIVERARAKAAEFHIPKACPVEELFQDPEIEIVVNLTIPHSHARVAMAALKAGKHVYGTEGSLSVPDPNSFGGPVRVCGKGDKEWKEMPLSHGYAENSRGLGVVDMAAAIQSGRKHRASGELAFHVLDIMQALHESSDTGRHVQLTSTCEKPAALPTGLSQWTIDT